MCASLTHLFRAGDPHFERSKNNKSYQYSHMKEMYVFFQSIFASVEKIL